MKPTLKPRLGAGNLRLGAGIVLLCAGVASAAELKPETLNAWEEYVRGTNLRMQERVSPGHIFLWTDENALRAQRVHAGEVIVAPATEHTPHHVSSGLIHHWIGAAFVRDAKLDDVLNVLRDYERYKEIYRPHVLESKTLRQDRAQDQFSLVLMNKAVVMKMALDSDYRSRYFRVDAKRAYGISDTTRVQEIENFGMANERKLPADQGSGYIWRLHSVMRFEERDGGVYVEVEAIALSRDIPAAVRWMVDPIVKRVSRSSVATSLKQTQEAAGVSYASAAAAGR